MSSPTETADKAGKEPQYHPSNMPNTGHGTVKNASQLSNYFDNSNYEFKKHHGWGSSGDPLTTGITRHFPNMSSFGVNDPTSASDSMAAFVTANPSSAGYQFTGATDIPFLQQPHENFKTLSQFPASHVGLPVHADGRNPYINEPPMGKNPMTQLYGKHQPVMRCATTRRDAPGLGMARGPEKDNPKAKDATGKYTSLSGEDLYDGSSVNSKDSTRVWTGEQHGANYGRPHRNQSTGLSFGKFQPPGPHSSGCVPPIPSSYYAEAFPKDYYKEDYLQECYPLSNKDVLGGHSLKHKWSTEQADKLGKEMPGLIGDSHAVTYKEEGWNDTGKIHEADSAKQSLPLHHRASEHDAKPGVGVVNKCSTPTPAIFANPVDDETVGYRTTVIVTPTTSEDGSWVVAADHSSPVKSKAIQASELDRLSRASNALAFACYNTQVELGGDSEAEEIVILKREYLNLLPLLQQFKADHPDLFDDQPEK